MKVTTPPHSHESPLVSVIIDNYNYDRFVAAAVESALQFDPQHVEVIVVDDGSTDDSKGVLSKFTDQVQLILKQNGGQASAFNAGLDVAKGDWIIFLDADDMLTEHTLEIVKHCMASDVSKITWEMPIINPAGKRTGQTLRVPDDDSKKLLDRLRYQGPHSFACSPTSGNVWSRQFLEKVRPIPEGAFRRGADGYLLHISPIYGRTVVAAQPGSVYRKHGSNFLAGKNEFEIRDVLRDRFERTAGAIRTHLKRRSLQFDWSDWGHDHWDRLDDIEQAINEHVPQDAEVVLIDDDTMNVRTSLLGRPRHYLLADDNQCFAGPPADGDQAVEQLREYNQRGIKHVVIVWYCYWWLDHYAALQQELANAYAELYRDASVLICKHTSG